MWTVCCRLQKVTAPKCITGGSLVREPVLFKKCFQPCLLPVNSLTSSSDLLQGSQPPPLDFLMSHSCVLLAWGKGGQGGKEGEKC